MGNQLSNEQGSKGPTRTFGRTGALGLSKAELDKRCTPSGLYPTCHWEEKIIRRLIGDGRLAARLKGNEQRLGVADTECPICFLHYSQTNETQCCRANICTECFLQVRPQKEKQSACPFCNNPKMFVAIAKRLDASEIQERETKEQILIEATIRARANGELEPTTNTSSEGFGSSLEQNDIVRRARSRTMSAEDYISASRSTGNREDDIQLLRQLSLSSSDRQSLEEEMRAQHTHPLALQMEAEAEERRIANEREYNRNNPRARDAALTRARGLSSSTSMRNRLSRMNPSGRRFGGESWDDMVVMEAAIMLSMEEDARARANTTESADSGSLPLSNNALLMQHFMNGRDVDSISGLRRRLLVPSQTSSSGFPADDCVPRTFGSRGLTEDEQVAMAIVLSMQEHKEKEDEGDANGDDTESNTPDSTADSDTPRESAPPKDTSSPSSCGVASLPILSEDDHDQDDDEEQIVFSDHRNKSCTGKTTGEDEDDMYSSSNPVRRSGQEPADLPAVALMSDETY